MNLIRFARRASSNQSKTPIISVDTEFFETPPNREDDPDRRYKPLTEIIKRTGCYQPYGKSDVPTFEQTNFFFELIDGFVFIFFYVKNML